VKDSADAKLLDDCYETLMAIYEACADRDVLPVALREALERHEPLLGALTDRVAP
jgi:hypothetical protein